MIKEQEQDGPFCCFLLLQS